MTSICSKITAWIYSLQKAHPKPAASVQIPKRLFTICKISPEEYPRVAQIANLWHGIATRKEAEAQQKAPSAVDNFQASIHLAERIRDHLQGTIDHKIADVYETYICRDDEGLDQGIMIIDTRPYRSDLSEFPDAYLYVNYLATHPRNIDSAPVNGEEKDRVKGVGTAFMEFAIKEAIRENRDGIAVEAITAARPFYKKLGFLEPSSHYMFKLIQKVTEIAQPILAAAAA